MPQFRHCLAFSQFTHHIHFLRVWPYSATLNQFPQVLDHTLEELALCGVQLKLGLRQTLKHNRQEVKVKFNFRIPLPFVVDDDIIDKQLTAFMQQFRENISG